MRVIIKKNFLTSEECAQLNDWVDLGVQNGWLGLGTNRGTNWKYDKRLTTRNYGDKFENPKVVHDVFAKITAQLNIEHLGKSTFGGGRDGVVVSCTKPGGDVYEHKDPMEGDLEVLRCNILTRKADAGGELFVGGTRVDAGVGDLHCYLASAVSHYVTEVQGETSRVLWMFGYQASPQDFAQIKVA